MLLKVDDVIMIRWKFFRLSQNVFFGNSEKPYFEKSGEWIWLNRFNFIKTISFHRGIIKVGEVIVANQTCQKIFQEN